MNEKQNSHSVFVLFIVLSSLVVISSFSVYKRASNQGSKNVSHFLPNSPTVLGDTDSTSNEDRTNNFPANPIENAENDSAPNDLQTENSGNGSDDSTDSTKSNPTSDNSTTNKQELLVEKVTLISSQVKNGNVDPKALFSPILVDFFGEEELQIVFEGVTEVTFENLEVLSEKEGKGNCTLVEQNKTTEHICYFSFRDGQWYLYKTQEK